MKFQGFRFAMLAMFLIAGSMLSRAATITVGPSGQYTDVCTAIKAANPGDTVTIDYNNGIPYTEPAYPSPNGGTRSDCVWFTNDITVVGVNGRPVLDATGENLEKGIFDTYGANNVISNLEMKGATATDANGHNAAAVRVDIGGTASPAGGNITIENCYIHDNQDGVLGSNVGPQYGTAYYSSTPFITLQYDEFYHNGTSLTGDTHNMYIGYDENNATVFTLQYSWTHDAQLGHEIKTRDPQNNIQYNLDTDELGLGSYLLDFCSGGTSYVLGNSFYKAATNQGNKSWMVYRDVTDNTPTDPEYDVPYQDLHFINNSVVLDPQDEAAAFVLLSCNASDVSQCGAPGNGPVLSTNAVVENNIFVGNISEVVNQSTAVQSHNVTESYSDSNLASTFVDWTHFDFHLVSGSPAIQAGMYPPTDNQGNADPKAVAKYEYVQPVGSVARPTPSGSTMDAGAYSYPRADTPPTPNLSYTQSVAVPNSGTITISGLPTPPAGQYNNAYFVVSDTSSIAPISLASSSTGTITTTFQTLPTAPGGNVTIDIYVDGAHVQANVTVTPGPPVLSAITLDSTYAPFTTVHLEGPAPAGGTVIDLSSSDPTYLYVPPTVTVPAGAVSAETGSNTGSLWGQTPPNINETITATQGSVQKSLVVNVTTPGIHSCGSQVNSPVTGGQPTGYQVTMRGYFPNSGGDLVFTSSNPAVIPNQSILEYGSVDAVVPLATNAVSTSTVVNIYLNVNGQTISDHEGTTCTAAITVNPATGSVVSIASGNQQTATVGTNFATPLAVTVTNNGSPVSGTTVTFAGSGVSFPGGATAVTNASGVAQVVAQPTTTGALLVTATAAGVSGSATFSETGNGGTPASIVAASGSGQSSAVGLNFANALVAQVKDASGNPVSGVTVTFAGSGVSFPNGATATTDANGNAQMVAQPTTTGSLTVTASAGGVGSTANFSVTGTPVATTDVIAIDAGGPAAGVFAADEYGSGGSTASTTNTIDVSGVTNPAPQAVYQSERYHAFTYAIPGLTPGASYTVRLHFADFASSGTGQREFNVVINNNQVLTNFDIIAAAGAPNKAIVEPFTAIADSTGTITIYFTFGLAGSPQVAGIEIMTSSTAGSPASIAAVSGSGQTAGIGSNFSNPLVAVVHDANNNPVSGVTVTFAGSGISFPSGNTAVTNGSGQASVTAQPTSVGSVTATASVAGVSGMANFSDTGTAGAAANIAAASGSGQSAVVGTNFSNPLVAVVTDAGGNPVSGATVTFAGSGVSFPNGATATTDANGDASVTAQPTSAGSLTVTASVAGVSGTASFSETGTSSGGGGGSTDVVAIASAGPAVGNYSADEYYSGGNDSSFSGTVNTSNVVNPPPAGVYQNQRWGVFTYTIPGLTAGATYTVRMHFAEEYWSSAGQRQFNVAINGQQVLTNFDILATAGGPYIAVAEDFTAVANSSGQIVISFTQGAADYPTINGFEIQPANDVVAINSAGSAAGSYSADEYATGGGIASSFSSTVSTSGVVNAPPQAVYQSQLYAGNGNITYTIPGLTAGGTYTVRLHFAELYFNSAGQRVFNVTINGTQVLTNFDIFAAAGGQNIAIAEDFTAVANSSGQIVIGFNNGEANYAAINGIEIQGGSGTAPSGPAVSSITMDSPYAAATTVHLSAAAPAGGAVVSLSSSDTSVLYTPATVTIPAGQTSAETGTLLGSLWGPSPSSKSATLTATYNGSTQTLTASFDTPFIHGFGCNSDPCSTTGGGQVQFLFEGGYAPVGGAPIYITSDNPSVVPNQTYTLPAGQGGYFVGTINTNAVSSTQTANVTMTFNGQAYWSSFPVTVNP